MSDSAENYALPTDLRLSCQPGAPAQGTHPRPAGRRGVTHHQPVMSMLLLMGRLAETLERKDLRSMRSGTILIIGACVTAVVACSSTRRSTLPPARTEIRVSLRASPAEALRSTRSAFETRGFETELGLKGDSVVTTVPKLIAHGLQAMYRAAIQPADSGAVVTLTGWVFNQTEAAWDWVMLGIRKRGQEQVSSRMRDQSSLAWTQLQSIAEGLRATENSKPDSAAATRRPQ